MTYQEINALFGIKEYYELPDVLMQIMLDNEKRQQLERAFIENEADLQRDVLRDYFQESVSDRKNLKQDYTPDDICDLIGKIIPETDNIIDICSGTGALTIGTKKKGIFQCEELSGMSIPILLFNLSIRRIKATVLQKDILTREVKNVYKIDSDGRVEHSNVYKEIKSKVVISNPPYSLPWHPVEDERFSDWGYAPKSKADYAFILDALSRLESDGMAFLILPHGVLFRGSQEGKIREMLLVNNLIDAIIGLPGEMFLNTQIPTLIMVLNKNKKTNNTLFIDASKECKKEGKQNRLSDIDKIADTYLNRKEIPKYSHIAELEEIIQNDYNLNIPRYIDSTEEKPPIILGDVVRELINIEKEIRQTQVELAGMLSEMTTCNEEDRKALKEFEEFLRGAI